MTITRLLAQLTVADESDAKAWYTGLFGRGPDARPMPGLLEWHLADTFGIQVWAEPARAGNSSVVLDESDLAGRARELDLAGISHQEPLDATTVRILQLEDPDGNRIVFTAPLSQDGTGR